MWSFRSLKQAPKTELINFLKTIPYFQSLPETSIKELSEQFKPCFIQSGEVIIKEGEMGDSLYIVQTGRLLVTKIIQNNQQIIGEMVRGDLVGELSLFTQQARAATVIAIRDSFLWKLSKEQFDIFVEKNSTHVMPIVRTAILRLLKPNTLRQQTLRSLAIAPAGRYPLDKDFIRLLAEQLSLSAPTLLVNSSLIKNQFKELKTNNSLKIELTDPRITEWLNEQEQKYTYVLYEADDINTEWTRLCLRQADKIFLFADSADTPKLGGIEQYLFYSLEKNYRPPIELFLLHDEKISIPIGTIEWLKERPIKGYQHFRKGHAEDLQRIIRLILGRGVGLVLGGGGAKSFAHIGVYKALCELKIPVDFVGGTSMGSIIAAGIAMNFTIPEMIESIDRYVIKNKKFNDYTIPSVSLLGGGGWLYALKSIFGDTYIEDLWRPFFCVASNFTLRKVELIKTGPVYKAVRASASLPGVVPPISNERNELLVDGGIFNNVPVDIMRNFAPPCEIIAVRVSPFSNVHAQIPDGIVSGFKRYFSRFGNDSLKRMAEVPSLSEIIIGTITLCNDEKELIQLSSANHALDINLSEFSMLDFSKLPDLIELGYQAAMEQFQSW
ncbi:patatin-like phospholipase family protein [Legionella sp. km772]|uniref:patatin-like phospholipase family protein n=1 Tax=Legionella sp. km772 TaxID=2498111 RepID=UPI000F8D3D4F|nr:patatin-like phospholipase family protein [Legionella sp. km772]RUR12421.1 cyclic nucleotide-binding domain-containing protein [Legionella sp. km772]